MHHHFCRRKLQEGCLGCWCGDGASESGTQRTPSKSYICNHGTTKYILQRLGPVEGDAFWDFSHGGSKVFDNAGSAISEAGFKISKFRTKMRIE